MKKLIPKNKRFRKILLWIGGILIFLFLLNLGINQWIKSELPAIIKDRNDTAYDFDFKDLRFSILNSSISVNNISIKPKKDYKRPVPVEITAKIDEINVVGVNFIKLLTEKDLSAYRIKIDRPDVIYTKTEKKDTTQHDSKLGNVISVSNFEISNGRFQIIDIKKEKTAEIQNITIEIGGVNLSQRTLEKDIPFTYTSFELDCGNIFYQINSSQELKANLLKVNDNLFILKEFKINSTKNVSRLDQKHLNYRLLPDITAPNVSFTGLDWGYDKSEKFYFSADLLKFDSVDINIKNDKDNPDRKRDSLGYLIPFKLDIAKVRIGNSTLKVGKLLDGKNLNVSIDSIKNEVNKKLSAESILIKNPTITTFLIPKKTVKKIAEKVDFKDFIEVKNLIVENGQYKLTRLSNNYNLLKIDDINFNMDGIQMTPETFSEQIPVTYENVQLSAASINYNPDNIYSLKTKKILLNNGNFSLSHFEMKPKISRAQFVKQLKKEKDLYTISAAKIDIKNMDWGFNEKDMFFKIPKIEINKADANIYRSKIPPDDPKKKLLYSKMLRDLNFILEVKQVDLKNSRLEYEEETEKSTGAGKLIFADFQAKINNVYSGYKKSNVPDLKADIKTNFMNDSKLNAVWTFNPMNRSEKFNIKGNIYNFDGTKMTPFIKPYLHATTEGNIREVHFNFTGNDIDATGDFGIKYDNLKVTLYNKNTGEKQKIFSALGNLLVKKDTKDKYKEERIKTVIRNQDRSFFNFFWNCVQQGLKQTLLVI